MKLLLLIALAATPAEGPLDPVASMQELQLIGWSKDETRYAVRAFDRFEEPPAECAGYVDHEGKRFNGRLAVAAYERGRLLESWVVQDFPQCTPEATAQATLAAAKAKLAELGIDLEAKGTSLPCAKGCKLPGGAALEVVDKTRNARHEDEEGFRKFSGTLRVTLRSGKQVTQLFEKSFQEAYMVVMGATMSAGLEKVWLSPSGKVFLTRAVRVHSTARGPNVYPFPLGPLSLEKP